MARLSENEEIISFRNRYLSKEGVYHWIEWRTKPEGDLVYAVARDVTDKVKAEEALRNRLEFEKMISELSSLFINITPGEIDDAINHALRAVTAFFKADRGCLCQVISDEQNAGETGVWCTSSSQREQPGREKIRVDFQPWWYKQISAGDYYWISSSEDIPADGVAEKQEFEEMGLQSRLYLPVMRDGKIHSYFILDSQREIEWSQDQVVLLRIAAELIVNALVRYDHDQQIRAMSFHDRLTGLYNRNYFVTEMQRLEGSRNYPIAIISADLDGLKLINDTLGHSMGDRYLQAGANLLKGAIRSSDLLARVGGDEFALVLPGAARKAAEELIKRINNHVKSYNQKTPDFPLSISLGLAISENQEMSLETTYQDADAMMYKEKLKRGKNHRTTIIQSMLSSLQKEETVFNEKLQELSVKLGQAAGLEPEEIARLQLFTRVYHLGLVNIPKELLKENAGLSEGEVERIRQHPERGYRIALASDELTDVAELILCHHEKYDGSGYPRGLAGDDIPLPCRILSIVESYLLATGIDAHSPGRQPSAALSEIESESGKSFDPCLVEKFAELIMAQ